ncbi:MAG TPA: dihydrofolate reductase family protein [Anaerolineales bacterium]|nr:dihydrofolate reductase family protein [Anaerolineales bacterium]
MANGDFTGYEYQVPIIVLTHHPPEIVALGADDRLTFTFVIDGIEHAIQEAKAAARNKDVTVVGGASTAQQCINAGLFDELEIGIVPILLGGGLRFFDNISLDHMELEKTRILESPSRIDLRYRRRLQ